MNYKYMAKKALAIVKRVNKILDELYLKHKAASEKEEKSS